MMSRQPDDAAASAAAAYARDTPFRRDARALMPMPSPRDATAHRAPPPFDSVDAVYTRTTALLRHASPSPSILLRRIRHACRPYAIAASHASMLILR